MGQVASHGEAAERQLVQPRLEAEPHRDDDQRRLGGGEGAHGGDGEQHQAVVGPGERAVDVDHRGEGGHREAGLKIGTAVEPIGPENTVEQLVASTLATRDFAPVGAGGAVRRVPVNGHPEHRPGAVVGRAQIAHYGAVIRLALGRGVAGCYVHEPDVLGAQSGANVIWSVVGPKLTSGTAADSTNGWGLSVADCQELLREADWQLHQGPSQLFR